MDIVIDFIQSRFPTDSNGLSGNCYYFATILKARFPEGDIYYDVIKGHFIFKYENKFYDWAGEVKGLRIPILGRTFRDYDETQYKRIVENCIK